MIPAFGARMVIISVLRQSSGVGIPPNRSWDRLDAFVIG
jgi:hypothetical protein